MLKRTLGRSLLTLLVITGLAGTINNSSMSGKERKYALALMKEGRTETINSIRGLSKAQLNFKETPDQWSVKECVFHLAGAEKTLWELLETSMKGPANPEKRSGITVTDEELVRLVEDPSNSLQWTELPANDKSYSSIEAALEDFKKTRTEHIKYMKSSTEDLRNHVVQLPLGWIDCYQLSLVIGAQGNRYTQQINEIKSAKGFPKP